MQQFDRVERYLQRIRDIYAGLPYAYENVAYYEDDVISFFIHCYHLRDWISKLNCVGENMKDVDAFINTHHELKVCADLCNGSKHCRIEKVRSGDQPHIVRISWYVTSYTPEAGLSSKFRARFQIMSHETIYDALELAEKCWSLWIVYRSNLADRA